jgi:hypothetical protein
MMHEPRHSETRNEMNFVLRVKPMVSTTRMMATDMAETISPYSMAVVAVSSLKKEDMASFTANSFCPAQGTW